MRFPFPAELWDGEINLAFRSHLTYAPQGNGSISAGRQSPKRLFRLVAPRAALPPRARARDDEPVLFAPNVHVVIAARVRAGPAATANRVAPRREMAMDGLRLVHLHHCHACHSKHVIAVRVDRREWLA